jgi:hypothetical protein
MIFQTNGHALLYWRSAVIVWFVSVAAPELIRTQNQGSTSYGCTSHLPRCTCILGTVHQDKGNWSLHLLTSAKFLRKKISLIIQNSNNHSASESHYFVGSINFDIFLSLSHLLATCKTHEWRKKKTSAKSYLCPSVKHLELHLRKQTERYRETDHV